MHRAGQYMDSLCPAKDQIHLILTPNHEACLHAALKADAKDYFYSACVSLVDAIRGLQNHFYSWSTVKLYYSVFYAARSYLALNRIAVYYVSSHQFMVKVQNGSSPHKVNGNTHKSVLKLYKTEFVSDPLLSQAIDLLDAPDWMMSRREECNYACGKFPEPFPPSHFSALENYSIRNLLQYYIYDTSLAYVFDPDHAILAYPIQMLLRLSSDHERSGGIELPENELNFLNEECRDKSGRLNVLSKSIFKAYKIKTA